MPHVFRVRRGLDADIPVLAAGEPALTTDTNKFLIGTSEGNVIVAGVGTKGDKGDVGPSPTITIGEVSNSLPGETASVINTGSDTEIVLNFSIPTGQTGPKGETGPIGVVWKGTWSNIENYVVNDMVYYENCAWICVFNNSNKVPSEGEFWNLLLHNLDQDFYLEHTSNVSNPHSVTCEQVGATPISHASHMPPIVSAMLFGGE